MSQDRIYRFQKKIILVQIIQIGFVGNNFSKKNYIPRKKVLQHLSELKTRNEIDMNSGNVV